MNETNEKKNIFLKINWWWVSAICFGIWLILLLIFSGVNGVHAAEVVPSGDLQDSEAVIATWDGSTLYAPEPYFTTSYTDTYYPGETVYYDDFAVLENSKIRFRYYVQGEQYDSFFPDQVMCAVFASDGSVIDHYYVNNEFSIYDYAFSRGYLTAWSNNLVYVNTDLGYSFADIDVLGISGRVLYFSVYQNEVDHYYAAQISSGTFSIVESPNSITRTILSSAQSSNISLFSWNSSTREWDLITANASESVLDAYPVNKILRLQGTSALYFEYGGFTRLEPVYFRDEALPPDPEITPTPIVGNPYIIVHCDTWNQSTLGYGYYCFEFDGFTFGNFNTLQPLQNNTPLQRAMSEGCGQYWVSNVMLYPPTSGSTYASLALNCTAQGILRMYKLGTYLVSTDLAFIKSNFSEQMWSGMGTFYSTYRSDLSLYNWAVDTRSGAFDLIFASGIGNYKLVTEPFSTFGSGLAGDTLYVLYRYGLEDGVNISPTPTPEPTLPPGVSPTPTPDPNATPTPTPPTVIINWPTSTPMPTPVIQWNPPGSIDTDLPGTVTKNLFSRGLDWFRSNMSSGLLSKAFSFIPPELQWLSWFLVFALILLAVVRLILHFGG